MVVFDIKLIVEIEKDLWAYLFLSEGKDFGFVIVMVFRFL